MKEANEGVVKSFVTKTLVWSLSDVECDTTKEILKGHSIVPLSSDQLPIPIPPKEELVRKKKKKVEDFKEEELVDLVKVIARVFIIPVLTIFPFF